MRVTAQETPVPSTELAVVSAAQGIVAAEFFKPGGSQEILGRIKDEVRKQAQALDISTEAGRKAIASLAYKIARSKTALDEEGANLAEEHLRAKQAIDAERRTVRTELDALKDEVRKPLTDWESAEKARVAEHERALNIFSELVALPLGRTTPELIGQRIEQVQAAYARNWQEFSARAKQVHDASLVSLRGMLEAVEREEAERAELDRLRAEAEEKRQRERDEAIAKAAREAAERKAEEQARRAREASERERQRVENERAEAEARAKQAEARRIADEQASQRRLDEAEARRVREAREAQERAEAAERRAEQIRKDAVETARMEEQKRQDDARKALAESIAKRERNRRHRETIHAAILKGFDDILGNDHQELAAQVAQALIDGKIPHVTVNY